MYNDFIFSIYLYMEFSFQFFGISEITLQLFHETEMLVSPFFIGGLMKWVCRKPESDDQFLKSCLSISMITFLHLEIYRPRIWARIKNV